MLTFSQFVDYLLWNLYVAEREHGGTEFLDLNDAASLLHQPVPSQWVFDAGRVLEARGLVRLILAFGGYAGAMLTGEGRIYVEENLDDEDAFIHKFAKDSSSYLREGEPALTRPETLEDQRAPAFDLVAAIEAEVREASQLSEPEKADLLSDLATIRAQLSKHEPNRAALAALLEPLSEYSFVAGAVSRLIDLLNPSTTLGY